jgi:hypothetical protein
MGIAGNPTGASIEPDLEKATRGRYGKTSLKAAKPLAELPILDETFTNELLAKDDRPAYDALTAYALAVVSAWSYADEAALQKKLRFYGFPECTVRPCTVTNDALFIVATAYVVRSRCGRLAIVAFRGTEPINLISWLTDSDVITCTPPPEWETKSRIHRGFFSNFEAVWDDVAAELRSVPDGGNAVEKIYVTGHSLGGAMAVLAGAHLLSVKDLGPKLQGVYTYGQPAVGDETFAGWGQRRFGKMLFRHVYEHDVVPQLPPTSTGKFVHFGHEHRSSGHGEDKLWRCEKHAIGPVRFALAAGVGALLDYVARRTTAFSWIPFPNSIGDHSPAFYVRTSRNYARAKSNTCPP